NMDDWRVFITATSATAAHVVGGVLEGSHSTRPRLAGAARHRARGGRLPAHTRTDTSRIPSLRSRPRNGRRLDSRTLEWYMAYSSSMARRTVQLTLPTPPSWGGRRAGAGRKPAPGRRPGVAHRARPVHVAAHPVHVTLRAAVSCLRSTRVFPFLRSALSASSR